MSRFTEPLQYKPLGNGEYGITRAFAFFLSDSKCGEHVSIPDGYVTNFASVPKFAQWLLEMKPDDMRWAQPATVHDALVGELQPQLPVTLGNSMRYLSWQEAADWFAAALKAHDDAGVKKIGAFKRWLIVTAVRTYGLVRHVQAS